MKAMGTMVAAVAVVAFGAALPVQAAERTVTSKDMGGRSERTAKFCGAGDYTVRYRDGGYTNFRLRSGECHWVKLREGDVVTRTASTLPR